MNIDLHNHSINSMDGEFTVHEMVSAAAGKHVDVFAVTDHCEVNQWEELHLSETVPASFLQIEAEKPLTSLCLLAGVELGQPLQNPERSRWVLNRFRWDFVIGSLHNTSGDPDFYFMDFAAMSDGEIHRALKKYYSELLEMAEWGNFDTLAHITYPYRYLNAARAKREIQICAEDFDEDAAAVMKKLIEKQIALELNGSSITRTAEDRELNIRYFKMYRELGGKLVTTGSDAHSPDRIAAGIPEAYGILRDAGFDSVFYYKERKAVRVALGREENQENQAELRL